MTSPYSYFQLYLVTVGIFPHCVHLHACSYCISLHLELSSVCNCSRKVPSRLTNPLDRKQFRPSSVPPPENANWVCVTIRMCLADTAISVTFVTKHCDQHCGCHNGAVNDNASCTMIPFHDGAYTIHNIKWQPVPQNKSTNQRQYAHSALHFALCCGLYVYRVRLQWNPTLEESQLNETPLIANLSSTDSSAYLI